MRYFLFVIVFLFSSLAQANTRDGLVGWWKFDEVSGTSAFDSSWKGNVGTATGTTIITNCPRASCRSFNGSGDKVDAGGMTSLDNQSAQSGCAWIKPNVLTNHQEIFSRTTGGGHGIDMETNGSSGAINFSGEPRNGQINTGNVLTIGVWTHVCGTANTTPDSTIVYVNGASSASGTTLYGGSTGGNLTIGTGVTNGTGIDFNGAIDEVRLYNRILTAQEVKDLYNAGIREHYAPGT